MTDAIWKGNETTEATPSSGQPGGGRPARHSLLLSARLTIGDEGEQRDVRVRNLSERGLMIELDRMLDPGTRVTLEMRGVGRVQGEVAWYAAGRAGVALDQLIDPAQARRPIVQRPRPL